MILLIKIELKLSRVRKLTKQQINETISLAQFVSNSREKLGFSKSGLAKLCNLTEDTIESIELGQELFLSSTVRQKLAKGLKLNPNDIKIYEKDFNIETPLSFEEIENIKFRILNNENEILCPKCKSTLNTRIAKMYDLEDNLILHPKANCSKCTFQIK